MPKAALYFLALGCWCSTLRAQPRDSVKVISPVVVNGSSISFQDQAIVTDSLHGQNLADALMWQANAIGKMQGATGLASVFLGGLPGNQTALMWHGMNLQNSMNGFIDLRTVPAPLFGKMQVSTSAAATPGGGGIGGSIQLGQNHQHNRLWLQQGSFGQWAGGANINTQYQKVRWDLGVFAETQQNNYPYTTPLGDRRELGNAHLSQWHIMPSAAFSAGKKGFVQIDAWYANTYREIPATLHESRSVAFQDDDNLRVHLNYKQLSAKGYWQMAINQLYDRILFVDSLKGIRGDNASATTRFKAEHHWLMSHDEQKRHWTIGGFADRLYATTLQYHEPLRLPRFAVFAQHQRQVPGKYQLAALLRAEYFNGMWPITGHVDLKIPLSSQWSFMVNAGRAFRYPTFNDLYWQPGGNPALKPEKSWKSQIAANYAKVSPRHTFTFTGQFSANHVEQLINWLPGPSGVWQAQNVEEVLALTGNLQWEWEWQVTAKCHLAIKQQVSRTQSRDITDSLNGYSLPYIPPWQLNHLLSAQLGANSLRLNWQYVAQRPVNADHSSMLDAYHLVNFSFARKWTVAKAGKLQTALSIRNLLNQNYYSTITYPMPGIHYQLTVQFYFNQKP